MAKAKKRQPWTPSPEQIVTAEQKTEAAAEATDMVQRQAYRAQSDDLGMAFLAKLAETSDLPEAKAWLAARMKARQ